MINKKYVVWNNENSIGKDTLKEVGGKALGLFELKKLGLSVPDWTVVTNSFFENIKLRDNKLKEYFTIRNADQLEQAKILRDYIVNMNFTEESETLLEGIWLKLSKKGKIPLAIRSSAADEDGSVLSFAGQMDTFLNIKAHDDFLRCILKCWASLFGERAMVYRMNNGLDPWTAGMGVVVQQMVQSVVSGVIFTANPLNNNYQQMLISSTWGIGEGLVSGALDADVYTISKEGDILEQKIAEKKQSIVLGDNGGTLRLEIPERKQKEHSLTREQIRKLSKAALKIHGLKNVPMDIEFAIVENKIFFLQARPITTLKKENIRSDNFTIWDNSNIVESYAGVTTPLTFSFIKKAYFAVYWQFCQTIGIDNATMVHNKNIFENMLGLIGGRVYYNLLNWYRLVSLMPGFKYNKTFMEEMMGLQNVREYFNDEHEEKSLIVKYFIYMPRLLNVARRMILAHLTLSAKIELFHKNFRAVYEDYVQKDYEKMTVTEIMRLYRDLERKVLWQWKAPILNDLEAMIFYGILRRITKSWGISEDATWHNNLLCGEGGIKSAKVVTELSCIAAKIKKQKSANELFASMSAERIYEKLAENQEYKEIKKSLDEYLKNYGVRGIDEMKLESVPLKEDPTFCISVIQNMLACTIANPGEQQQKERSIREKAEQELQAKLKGKRKFLVPKILIYNWVLKNTRQAIKNRENQRFVRAEAYGLVRTLLKSIGKKWETKGIIDKKEDIFYLEIDEIWNYIEGKSTLVNLKGLIGLRKEEFASYVSLNPDDHIETDGEVYFENLFAKKVALAAGGDILKGIGCCQGVVEKEVIVVLKPDKGLQLNGQILVARQTDPGWAVLFPSISGLIVEKGSVLSHSAIVAREMGIPAVVGVEDATTLLHSGDKVLLDGKSGTIKVLQRKE